VVVAWVLTIPGAFLVAFAASALDRAALETVGAGHRREAGGS
jgi:hypothetical protein